MPSHPSGHLHRLDRIWVQDPLYFVTVCTLARARVLADPMVVAVLTNEWTRARERHGWHVGRFVIMPDHVHFFAAPEPDARALTTFVARWKEWTSKRLKRDCSLVDFAWQPEFFDHLLRSADSYSEKWDYVRANPVQAGLVKSADDWPYQGHVHFL